MFVPAGVPEIIDSSVSRSWNWLWVVLSGIFILVGVSVSLIPMRTVLTMTDPLRSMLLLTGIF